MGSKKTTATAAGLPALKIGGRVRRTDDLAEGRIVWANGVSVKITWDDGEQVTWRRDSLADRPIEILADDENQPAPAASPAPAEPAVPETPPAAPESAQEPPAAAASPAAPTTVETPPAAAEAAPAPEPPIPARGRHGTAHPPRPANRRRRQASQEKGGNARRPRNRGEEEACAALDAAARVLAETGAPMGCKELIGAMAGKGYWMSPGGKTPAATLFSAIAREIATKGELARFTKAGPGRFGPRRA